LPDLRPGCLGRALTLAWASLFAIMHSPLCIAAATAAATSPAAVSESAPVGASTPMPANARVSGPDQQVHSENSEETFRNLVPSPLVEARSTAEYAQLLKRAQQEGRLLPPSDPRAVRVRAAVSRLAPFANKWGERVKDWKWEVNVIRSRDVNMYCLPGGKIVVYSGLLDRTHLRDDELGMLLGHEIAHAVREQVRQRLGAQQPMPPGAGASARLFGVEQLAAAPALTPDELDTSLLGMKFDAVDETEADVIGGDIAARAGYDPRAAVTLWDKLASTTRHDNPRTFIDMHPYSAARRRDIIKRLPDMLALYAKARGLALEQLPDYAGMKAVSPPVTRN
jgi:Zn-dependent protease with chaperone function